MEAKRLKNWYPTMLSDESYYFWHPVTETFLGQATDLASKIIGTPVAANFWEVRFSSGHDHPYNYCTLWSNELEWLQRRVLQLINHGTAVVIGTGGKVEGTQDQNWILRAHSDDDDEDWNYFTCIEGLTISPVSRPDLAITMEKVNGSVEGFVRPFTGANDQIFIPLRVQKHSDCPCARPLSHEKAEV